MKVSVLMVTYNHAWCIRQAIESVLAQEAPFDWELVIGEDVSTDDTAAIVREYEARHPDRIRAVWRPRNVGMQRNFMETLAACTGEYVAVLDGDDYWTSPAKLSLQAAFLDARPGHSMCFHDVEVVYEDQSRPSWRYGPAVPRATWGVEDLLEMNFIQLSSVMLRRRFLGDLPPWFARVPLPDWAVYMLLAGAGPIGYFGDVMTVYRVHRGGVVSGRSLADRTEAIVEASRMLNEHFDFRYNRQVEDRIARSWYMVAAAYAEQGDRVQARRYAKACRQAGGPLRHWSYRGRLFVRLYTPLLWRLLEIMASSLRGVAAAGGARR